MLWFQMKPKNGGDMDHKQSLRDVQPNPWSPESTHTGEYISRGIRKRSTKWSIKWYIFVLTPKCNPHWLGLSAQHMEFSVKYFEIDASDPKSRNSVTVS